MQYFDWGQNNFDVQTPHELQDRGVQVYFAPNIPADVKLINLETGDIVMFHPGESRRDVGYYAEYDSLQRYCARHGIPFVESSGVISVAPTSV